MNARTLIQMYQTSLTVNIDLSENRFHLCSTLINWFQIACQEYKLDCIVFCKANCKFFDIVNISKTRLEALIAAALASHCMPMSTPKLSIRSENDSVKLSDVMRSSQGTQSTLRGSK